jgi:hypothetical protein
VRLNFVDGVALVQGFARANQPQDFQFFGVAGETVLISLLDQPNGSAPPGGSFAVMGGANNVLYKSFAAPEMSWFFTLPVSQDYLITVLSSQDMVFTVEVAYPPAVAQQDTPSTANESPTEPSATEAATQSDGGGVLPACTNTTLLNGGFETDGFWILDGSSPAAQPVYVPDPVGSGRRALRLGLDPAAGAGGGDAVTLSSARQAIQIPADAAAVRLQWSHLDRTDEATSTAPGSDSERQEVLLLNGDGVTLAVLQSGRRNDSDWVTESVDLSPYIGQSLVLAFDVHNDGNGRATWQYLDDVTLFVCTAAPSQQTAP